MSKSRKTEPPLPSRGRMRVARDMLVFQAKLFTDGLKDIMLSPVALISGLIGILLSKNPGDPLYRTLRFGKRIENWIDLFGASYPEKVPDEEEPMPDFDTLVDRLQSGILDPEARTKLSEESKKRLDAVARKLRGDKS